MDVYAQWVYGSSDKLRILNIGQSIMDRSIKR